MSVTDNFKTFHDNLRMSTVTVDTIANRYKRITKQLNKCYWNSESETSHSLYVGSYGRGTKIHLSDIDMLFMLPYEVYVRINKYQGNGQSYLLQEVKNCIQRAFNSYMRGDGQVIKVDFTDGITYEIVPCFVNNDDSFTYPDTNNGGSWKTTNPKPEIAEMTAKNIACNKNLKRLCRMARAWKDKWNIPIGGLLIDTLAYNFIKEWKHRDKSYFYYDWMSRDFFKFLSEEDENKSYWLSPKAGQFVWRKGKFEHKAKQTYNRSLEAIQAESDEYFYTAKSKWREIYGTKFPN